MLEFTADLGSPDCLHHSLEKWVLLERHFGWKRACGRSSVLHIQKQTSTPLLRPNESRASYPCIPGEGGWSVGWMVTALSWVLSCTVLRAGWAQSCSICRLNCRNLLLPCCSLWQPRSTSAFWEVSLCKLPTVPLGLRVPWRWQCHQQREVHGLTSDQHLRAIQLSTSPATVGFQIPLHTLPWANISAGD